MSRAILAGLVALLGLTTGAAFATNDYLATQAASSGGANQLAYFSGSETDRGSSSMGGTNTNTSSSNSSRDNGARDSVGANSSNNSPSGNQGSQSRDNGARDSVGANQGNNTRSSGGGGNQGTQSRDDGARDSVGANQGNNTPSNTGNQDPRGNQPNNPDNTSNAPTAADRAAQRTQSYANDLSNYNRDRQSTTADIKAAKDAALSRLNNTPAAPTPRAPGMAQYGISPQQGVNRYTTSMTDRLNRFDSPADYDANTTEAQRQAVVDGLQDFSNRDQSRIEAGLEEGRRAQAEREAQAETDAWNDYSDLRSYLTRELANQIAEQEADQRDISDDDLRETAINAGFPTSLDDAAEMAERIANYVDPVKEFADRLPSVDPTYLERNYAAYNNPNAVNPNGTPAAPSSPSTVQGSPETVSSVSDPADVPTRESIREGLEQAGAFGPETPEEGPGSISEMVDQAYNDAMADFSTPEVNRTPPAAVFSGRGVTDPTAAAREYSNAIAKAEATRKAAEQRKADLANYGEAQDTMRMNAELDRRDREATARENAEASAQGLAGFGNNAYQNNVGTQPSERAAAEKAAADARARAEASAQGLAGFGNNAYQNNVGTAPADRAAADVAAANEASRVAEASRRQAESDARIAEQRASEAAAARARAEASAQGLAGFGNNAYQNNVGTAPADRVAADKAAADEASRVAEASRRQAESDARTAEARAAQEAANEASRVAEAARRQAESDARLAAERASAQAAANEASRVAEAARRQAESDARIAQARAEQRKADLANYGEAQAEMRVNAELDRRDREATAAEAEASRVAEASRRQAESDARIAEQRAAEVAALDAKAAANEASRIAEAARRQAVSDAQIAEQRAAEVARLDAEAAAANRSLMNKIKGWFGLGPTVSDVDPKTANAQKAAEARAAQAAADEASRVAEASRRQAEADARIAADRAASQKAAEARIAAISRGQGLSSPEQAENAFNNALADAKIADAEREPSTISRIATTIGDTWTGLRDSFAGMFGTTPTKQITDRLPGGEETTNVENGVLGFGDFNPSGTPTRIGSVVTQNDVVPETNRPSVTKIDDRLPGGELTDNVGQTGVIKDGNTVISKGVVVTKNDLTTPPARTTSIEPAVAKPDEQQAFNDNVYDGLPVGVVPGEKVTPKPAPAPSVNEDDENEVVVSIENVPEDEKPAPQPEVKKKSVIDTIRDLLPGGNPPRNQPRDEGGGGSDRPWWVREQTRNEPTATTTSETYDRSWIEALRARLGW